YVSCESNHIFCFKCGEKDHRPSSCFSTEYKSEKRSNKWKFRFTKRCPNCYIVIEKTGGCSQMKCPSCQVKFDW
ncbi:uncharacterized protein ASCRUDRAFT_25892, partial [Ascoidea rubescens DSM 1968]